MLEVSKVDDVFPNMGESHRRRARAPLSLDRRKRYPRRLDLRICLNERPGLARRA